MKTQILEAISQRPQSIREMFDDAKVRRALESVGILTTLFQLHAPRPGSRSSEGLGPTLCNYERGRRHSALVTCQKCLAKIEQAKKRRAGKR